MAISYNTSIVRDSLVLYLDAANRKSAKSQKSNILSWNDWASGTTGSVTSTGSWPTYSANGDGNSRVIDTNPFGTSDVVWDVSNQDAASDADGGWDSTSFPIDPTKTYRFSTWIRRKTIGNGSTYLGVTGYNSSFANIGVLNRTDGATNTNPYFTAVGWWGVANDWYLLVGHVWPAGSGTGDRHVDTGIYNTAGTKIANMNDFVWQITNARANHRSYLYYSTDITTNQQWYQPRVDLCDGGEPSISELINNAGNKLYDLSGNNLNSTLVNNAKFEGQSIIFDGTDDYSAANLTGIPNFNALTINVWFYSNVGTSTCLINNLPFILHFRGAGFYLRSSDGVNDSGYLGWQTLPAGNVWNMLTGTWDGTTMKLYLNGVKQTNELSYSGGSTRLLRANENVTIGGYFNVSQPWTNGKISNVAIYNRALSANEVRQNFNVMRGRYGI